MKDLISTDVAMSAVIRIGRKTASTAGDPAHRWRQAGAVIREIVKAINLRQGNAITDSWTGDGLFITALDLIDGRVILYPEAVDDQLLKIINDGVSEVFVAMYETRHMIEDDELEIELALPEHVGDGVGGVTAPGRDDLR